MRFLIVVLFIVFSTAASAESEFLYHLVSRHATNNSGPERYNNVNPGIGYNKDGLLVGLYRNSFFKPTVYVGAERMFKPYFGATLLAATGYDQVSGKTITPTGGLVFKYKISDTLKANLIGNTAVVHLYLSQKF